MMLVRAASLAFRARAPLATAVHARTFVARTPALAATYPRRVPSSFFLFSQDARPEVARESPNLSANEVVEELAQRFKNLPAEARARYDERAAAERERYLKAMEAYKGSINRRPRPVHLNTQLKQLAEQRGMKPTLDTLAQLSKTLTEQEKERLKEERTAAADKIRRGQEEWDRAHQEGLEVQRELEERFCFRHPLPQWFNEAKKRRWKAVAEFPRHFSDLTEEQREQVKHLRKQHRKRAKRFIRRTLRQAGYNDEAESL